MPTKSKTAQSRTGATRAEAKPEPPPLRAPTPLERREGEAAGERSWSRAVAAEVDVDRDGDDKPRLQMPYDDPDLWRAQLLDSFGTRSADFAARTLGDVAEIASAGPISRIATNAAVSLIGCLRPANEAEALLLAQMAGAHAGAMQAMKAMQRAEWFNQTEGWGRLANAFMRTYGNHLQTLDRIRRKGGQTVRVEHVHVHEGARAVVGHVEMGGGGERKIADQSHAPARQLPSAATQTFAPMWGEDAEGELVPGAGGEGQEAVPNARREEPRRTNGE